MLSSDVLNELEALKAIYDKDFEERPMVWNNASFVIRIRPINLPPEERFCSVLLHITLNKSYPKAAPKIDLEEVVGLNDKEIAELKKDLATVANNNIGEVMGHELASAAETFLEFHNKKPQSLYEAGLNRKKKEEAALKDLKEGTILKSEETPIVNNDRKKDEKDQTFAEPLQMRGHSASDRALSIGSDAGGDVEHWFSNYRNDKPMDNEISEDDLSLDSDQSDMNNNKLLADQVIDPDSRYYKEFKEECLLGKGAGELSADMLKPLI